MGINIEDGQSFSADTTPIAITSTLGAAAFEYEVLVQHPGAVGTPTVYIVASLTDTAANALAILPGRSVRSGPYRTLPFLYAASARAVNVTVYRHTQPSDMDFHHDDITDE